MYDPARHIALVSRPWHVAEVREAIAEIAEDARGHFDPETFWPAHPQDEGIADGDTSLYMGAAGVVWALHYLDSLGVTRTASELRASLPTLIERNLAEYNARPYAAHGSLLFGDMGTRMVEMRLAPSPAVADAVYTRAEANLALPIRELMWGMPGSMLACLHMAEMTAEDRWRDLFRIQAARLFTELHDTDQGPLWNQDLYGTNEPWLGPVHGYAGNMIPLLRGWKWLDGDQRARVAAAVPRTLALTARSSERGVNWSGKALSKAFPKLCQHCHGAPGMVTAFADAPFPSRELDELLLRAGELVWAAGPLAKGSNLCHGTGGNGYAFLKLYRRTGDAKWLERARIFAMMAIAQYREARVSIGYGRYSLWTGDVGLAIYLWDCVTGEPKFPTIDVF